MLPVYEAISYHERIEKGARTKPLIISVLIDDKPTPYVVKLYNKNEVSQYGAVTKEVFTTVLAGIFDLQRPNPALIKLGKDFLNTVPTHIRAQIQASDHRLKFACEYLEGATSYSSVMSKNTLEKYIDIDTIFAFDNLTRNVDRRIERANILLYESSAQLIDHEYSLNISPDTINEVEDSNWIYPFKKHIFYRYLKKHSKETKEKYFESFEFYLSNLLNPEDLNPYAEQLQTCRYPIGDFDFLKNYMYYMKKNSRKFVTLLKGLLE